MLAFFHMKQIKKYILDILKFHNMGFVMNLKGDLNEK